MTVTEVRVLEGPNLFFPRPAVKIILGCLGAAQATLRAISRRPGMHVVRAPGAPDSEQRQRAVMAAGGTCGAPDRRWVGHDQSGRSCWYGWFACRSGCVVSVALAGPRWRSGTAWGLALIKMLVDDDAGQQAQSGRELAGALRGSPCSHPGRS